MSMIGKYFSSASHPMTKKLQKCRLRETEEKWSAKAIDTLIKKLKKQKNALEMLEFALTNPDCPSDCVLLPRSSDGRLQVMHRKELPHVIYCRIWRWPDLMSHHELKSTEMCENPFSTKNSEICVNPYHYRRLGCATVPPVLVPRQSENQAAPSPLQLLQPLEPRLPYNVSYGTDGFLTTKNHKSETQNNYAKSKYYNNVPNPEVCKNGLMNYNTQLESMNIDFPNYNNASTNYMTESQNIIDGAGNVNFGSEYCNLDIIDNSEYFNMQNTNCNTETNFYYGEPHQNCNSVSSGQSEQSNPSPQNNISLMNSPSFESSPESSSQAFSLDNYYDSGNVMPTNVASMPMQNYSNNPQVTPVNYSEPKNWASIAYYELNSRVGEIYHCEHRSIIVDGYTDPRGNSNRFSLGMLSNVKRNLNIENTRRVIGNGLGLHYFNGELIAECLSEGAIFSQSRNSNHFNKFPLNTVCKIQPGCSLKIFSNEYFAQLLRESVNYGFDAVYELTKMCTIRISFIKGWGADYQRQDVTSTPCWIEIHLNGPLHWLDQVLNQMGPSIHKISSVS